MSDLPKHLEISVVQWKQGTWTGYEWWEPEEVPPEGVEIPTQEGTWKIQFNPNYSEEQIEDFEVI
ncbi:MAG: hypothetical protein F6K09_01240 [Merismopedia sp. SIO2A8]|nr:hypothetical protein [Symploca sp. SIO2B6]NET47353.1 hypothetical protein [Merismopedia sp. SIO2A8]